jgi:hypothetical protein
MWTERDISFFQVILEESGEIEKNISDGLTFTLTPADNMESITIEPPSGKGTPYETLFFPIGTYTWNNRQFEWYSNQMKVIYMNHMKKHYPLKSLFGSTQTIQKLFQAKYRLPEEYRNIPAYFLAMMNPAFRLVRFESPELGFLFWGLAKIDAIPYTFDFETYIRHHRQQNQV